MDFPNFCYFVRRFGKLTLVLCLQFVAEHFFGHMQQRVGVSSSYHGITSPCLMFFGVDELFKHPSCGHLVTAVVSTMDSAWTLFSECHHRHPRHLIILPVVTSPSPVALSDSAAVSGRRVELIPLGPLYGAADHIVELEPLLRDADASARKALRILCADLGEHGRMLEMLYGRLLENQGRHLRHLLAHGIGAISQILHDLEYVCQGYLDTPPDYAGLGIVTGVLLGRQVCRSRTPAGGCQRTHDQLQMRGIYISSAEECTSCELTFIPVMSPFQLFIWARRVWMCQKTHNLLKSVADVLLRMMDRDSTVGDYAFENFACGTRDLQFGA
jgi:hypothetical protein